MDVRAACESETSRPVTDSESAADHRPVAEAVSDSDPRSKIVLVRLHVAAHRDLADAADEQRIRGGVVIRCAARVPRLYRRVELVANAQVERKPPRYLPGVLEEEERTGSAGSSA